MHRLLEQFTTMFRPSPSDARPHEREVLVRRDDATEMGTLKLLLLFPLLVVVSWTATPDSARPWFVVAVAAIVALDVLGQAVPWQRLPRWTESVPPQLTLAAAWLWAASAGGFGNGYGMLAMPPVLWTALYADPVDVAIGVALLCVLVAAPAADLLPGLPDQGSLAVALTTVTMIAMVALLVRPLVVTLRERVGAARRATYSLRAAQAALAHDLRTPLTSICALGALTEERLEATPAGELPPPGAIEAARGYAARIVELGWRAEHTIRSVLELSQAGEAELDTSEFDVRAMLEQLASETPGVALVVDDVPARILAHEASIRRVFANLLENAARHATPAGARRDGDANAVARVTVRGRTLPTGWSFDVVDDGPGIDEAEAELLFEPWRRGATASDGGSGLGLAIVAAIVDQHGGTIGAGNASGAGARFSFSIRRLH